MEKKSADSRGLGEAVARDSLSLLVERAVCHTECSLDVCVDVCGSSPRVHVFRHACGSCSRAFKLTEGVPVNKSVTVSYT